MSAFSVYPDMFSDSDRRVFDTDGTIWGLNPPLDFEDSHLDKFPRMSVEGLRALSDAEITNLVKLIGKSSVDLEGGSRITYRCLLILALSEFRDPSTKERVFTLNDNDYKGRGEIPIFYPNLIGADSISPDGYTKDKEFIDAYIEVQNNGSNINTTSGFKTLAHYDLDDRCYIGAWSLFQFRCIVKEGKQMAVCGTRGVFSRLFRSLYEDVHPKVEYPALSVEYYERLNLLSKGCNTILVTLVIVCMKHVILNEEIVEDRNPKVYKALKGLLMATLENHGLPLYTFLISASEAAGVTIRQMISCCESIPNDRSLRNLKDFIERYIDGPEANKRRYFSIARLLNDDYLKKVGRKHNEFLIAALYTITKAANPSINYVGSKCRYWDIGCRHGERIARALEIVPRSSGNRQN